MSARRPLVSIGLPVYNGAEFVARALRSLRDQDYERLEIIVSDNGSDDDTEAICRSVAVTDDRVRYLRSPRNRGAAWNYVTVFEAATGEYFKWAAHDDLCRPTFVSQCVAVLEDDPGAVLCYPRTELIDLDDRPTATFDDGLALGEEEPGARLARLLDHEGEYHPIFGVIRRDALAATQVMGGYVGADVVTLAELALRGRFVEVEERLFLRRYHRGTSVIANPDPRSRAVWFDPDHSSRRPMPTARLTVELLRAATRSPLPPATRSQAALTVARHWAAPRWRDIGGEVKRSLLTRVTAPAWKVTG
jgi:glycosyltransferase involved in cell wall biosynthesis